MREGGEPGRNGKRGVLCTGGTGRKRRCLRFFSKPFKNQYPMPILVQPPASGIHPLRVSVERFSRVTALAATRTTPCRNKKLYSYCLVVIQLETHTIMYLVISERDVVLVNGVPFLDTNLLWSCAWSRKVEIVCRGVCVCVLWVGSGR